MRTELLILILAGFPPLAGNRNRNHTHKSLSEVDEVIAKQKKEKENRYDCTLFFISDKLSDKFFFCVAVNTRRKQK